MVRPQPAVFVERCASVAENTRTDMDRGNTTGNTERYDRVLALWMNLQKTMQFRWNNETREDVLMPWDCQDARVCNAWDALTHPRNEVALEILTYQLPEGQQLETARKALLESRKRQRGMP